LYFVEALHAPGEDEGNGQFYSLEFFACDVSGVKIQKKEIYFINSTWYVCNNKKLTSSLERKL
jgi:hypothetical protein